MRRIRKETSDYVNSIDRLILEQVPENSLQRIIPGLVVASLAVGLISLLTDGFSSVWLILAAGLLVGAGAAYVLKSVDQFVVAALVLVVVLVSTVAGMLLHPGASIRFIPYLFVPIVVLTGLILPPIAVVVTALSAIALTAIIAVLSGEVGPTNLLILLPPLGLIIIVGLLTTEDGHQIRNLQNLWLDSKRLLRERTWESVELQRAVRGGQRQIDQLEQELSRAKTEQMDKNKAINERLVKLLTGAVQELGNSTRELEQVVERVEELPLTENQSLLVQDLWTKIFHLTSLKVGLEDLGRLEKGEVRLERQAVDMADLIREVVGTAQGLAREKDLTLKSEIPADLPRFYVDPNRLRQALLRILSNAIQYSDEGAIEIQVDQNEYELLILISDTGIGIQPEESEVIFQNFGRASGDAARRRQGPGLGLSISKRLIKLHGGHLWVTSIPGVGSTFYVALPLAQLRQGKPPPPTDVPAVTYSPANGPAYKLKPEFIPGYGSLDPDATLLSRRRLAAKSDLGPVARFSPTYVNRLGLLFFGLLLLFSLCVALLALRNEIGTYPQTSLVDPSSAAESRAVLPTHTATFKTDVAAAPPPTRTPLVAATATATQSASSPLPPTATISPSSPFSPEPPPASPSPTMLLPTPLPTAIPTPTQAATVVLERKNNGDAAALSQPIATTTTTETPPTPRRRSQYLSFITRQNGINSVSRLNLDDGVREEVAVQTLDNSGISWSPSGRILFTADQQGHREIYVAGPDGNPVWELTASTGDSSQPAWSPDGSQIAFSSARTGNFEIFIMEADGSNPSQLTSSRGFDEWPVWSADGERLAFVSDRDGNVEIYIMAADGTEQLRLTNHPADDWPASWSPDGSRLVFASNRDGNWNLYLVDVASGRTARLTNDPANERDPAWAPDGRTIAFAYGGDRNWDIYTLPVPVEFTIESGRNEWRQITQTPLDERYPAWLP